MKNNKIAIHFDKRPGSYCHKWIDYCIENKIAYKKVDGYSSNIIDEIKDCEYFMWHFSENSYVDMLMARNVLNAIESAGKTVYPNHHSNWHFDDKTAQKYLLEAIEAPMVSSHVFYDLEKAVDWARGATYPLVFKLKGGSGSSNVFLINSFNRAKKIISKILKKGVKGHSYKTYVREKLRHFKANGSFIELLKIVYRFVKKTDFDNMSLPEKGYVYFQDFVPDNNSDTRIVVIGEVAFGIKRMVREDDFRASGSGLFEYDDIDTEAVRIAFDTAKKLDMQSVAFDFIFDKDGKPLIVELSYGFGVKGVGRCTHYWDADLNVHKGTIDPPTLIIENFLKNRTRHEHFS